MCGIVGYIGNKKASSVILDGLKKLEYRGYDSSGVCTFSGNTYFVQKDVGKIEEIESRMSFEHLQGNWGIGHCRWATHGGVTKENAHPHLSMREIFSIVHNGIIENYVEIKEELLKEGYVFKSETDTEIFVNLIESIYLKTNDIKETLSMVMKKSEGSFAAVIMCKEYKDVLFGLKQKSPLVIGIGEGLAMFASDVLPIVDYTKKIVYMDNGEIAILEKGSFQLFDLELRNIRKPVKEIQWTAQSAEKHGFPHYMLKEITEQPNMVTEIIKKYVDLEKNVIQIPLKKDMEEKLTSAKRIVFVSCGTSWHSSLIGEFMFEEMLRIPSEVEYASEFRYRNPVLEEGTVVIAISQSGETADTLAALEEVEHQGFPIFSIINVENSSIDRVSHDSVYTHAGPEIGVASTKAFTAQIVVLYLLMLQIGVKRKLFSDIQIRKRLQDLKLIPFQIQEILESGEYIKEICLKYTKKTSMFYLGRGINYPIALEGALKLKEVSYIHADGYPAAELKHGPIALIDKDMTIFMVATKDEKVYAKIKSNIQEVRARDGEVIAITSKGDKEILKLVDIHIHIPQNSYLLMTILSNVVFQLIAYHIAVNRGLDPDKPRNLAKSVTVE